MGIRSIGSGSRFWIGPVAIALALAGRLTSVDAQSGDVGPAARSSGHWSVSASLWQIQDDLNHGFLLSGPDLVVEYGRRWTSQSRIVEYEAAIGGGGKRIADSWGFRWGLMPLRFGYLLDVLATEGGSRIFVGPAASLQYDVQNYPDLHAGSVQWMTSGDVGIRLVADFGLLGRPASFRADQSLVSLVSRPTTERDPHVFRIGVSQILSDIHSNLGLFDLTDSGQLRLQLELAVGDRTSLGYRLGHRWYRGAPGFTDVQHSLVFYRFGAGT